MGINGYGEVPVGTGKGTGGDKQVQVGTRGYRQVCGGYKRVHTSTGKVQGGYRRVQAGTGGYREGRRYSWKHQFQSVLTSTAQTLRFLQPVP